MADEYTDGQNAAEDYQDALEAQQEQMEAAEDLGYMPNFPQQKPGDNLYSLFREVLGLQDNSKVGNLDKQELGDLGISVRDSQYIAMMARHFGYSEVESFFNKKSEILLKSSASKKGWFVELFVTQKKFQSKTASSSTMSSGQQQTGWFKKPTTPAVPQSQ